MRASAAAALGALPTWDAFSEEGITWKADTEETIDDDKCAKKVTWVNGDDEDIILQEIVEYVYWWAVVLYLKVVADINKTFTLWVMTSSLVTIINVSDIILAESRGTQDI